jgi:tetratricopeptide (TPR) repeat protein
VTEIDKMLEATAFIFEHAESTTEKSLIARSLASFAHERGKVAEIVKLYEGKLKQNPGDKPALYTLAEIYRRAEPNATRREELLAALSEIEKEDARQRAEKFEQLAAQQPDVAAWNWKEAASAWLQAGDTQKALEAAENAENAGPERRSDLTAHYWHKALGDIYLQLNEPRRAIPHYERAIEKTNIAGYIKACQEQLAKARAAAGS